WLSRVQQRQSEQREFEHTPLADIRRWSAVRDNRPLFRSLVVFENYPEIGPLPEIGREVGLDIQNVRCVESTNYPLNVSAALQGTLSITFIFDSERFARGDVTRLAQYTRSLLMGMAER